MRVSVTKPRGPRAFKKDREEANGVKRLKEKRIDTERMRRRDNSG